MIEHVTELLGIYLDGELSGLRLHQVEEHLKRCTACRKDLAELRGLSSLLQETVPMQAFPTAERFAANLALSLPRRPEASAPRKVSAAAGWLVPAGVVGLWVFMQAVVTVSSWVSVADVSGLLGRATAWIQAGAPQSLWYATSMNLFGSQVGGSSRTVLDVLNTLSVYGSSYAAQLIGQAALGVLILGWLAFWLGRRSSGRTAALPQTGFHS